MEHGIRFRYLSTLCFIVLVALCGCRESEQGRRLDTGKGTYAGAPDQQLSAEAREALGRRAEYQRF
ncbi:MAG: hypothetical protein F4Z93_00075 [Rhodospirillales bacterium]|nr:hypothetical protein [Rhodospirillales bacterium]